MCTCADALPLSIVSQSSLIDYKNAPFTQFLQSAFGLTDKVLTAVVYAIGFDGNDYGKIVPRGGP